MSFTTENRKISNVFQRSSIYTVPRYQRNYVWNRTNWSELINDIKFTMKVDNELEWSHFLGTIVLNSSGEKTKLKFSGIDYFEIVDGQQRMTTLYVLLCTICFCFKQFKDETSKNRAKYIYNTYIVSLSEDNEMILELDNPNYEKDLKNLVQNIVDGVSISNDNFYYDLFNYFFQELRNYTFEELDKFLKKLLDINVVEIVSDQEEEIYNIFEVLNARGQKLKQMELLKNHIMKYIQPRNNDFVDQAKDKWNQIMENASHLNDIDDLLYSFIRCYILKKVENSDSMYKLIKEEINIIDLSSFLSDFHTYSFHYKNVSDKNIADEYIKYFDIKRNKQVRSILAAINLHFENGKISQSEKRLVIENLRNFYFQFNLLNYSSNKIDKIIKQASYDVYHCKTALDFKFIISRLFFELDKFIDNKDNVDISNVTSLLYSNKNISLKRNNKLVKYVLCCLYQPLQKDTLLRDEDLTIEHLLNDDGGRQNSSLSNLTLTSEEINSEDLKNKQIKAKLEILAEQSSIKANQMLHEYLMDDESFNSLNRKNDITNQMFNHVFSFNPKCFNLKYTDIENYFIDKKLLESDDELLGILLEKGSKFQIYLQNDPSKKECYKRYLKLKKSN